MVVTSSRYRHKDRYCDCDCDRRVINERQRPDQRERLGQRLDRQARRD